MDTTNSRHDWERVRFVPPSGAQNAYYGKRCRTCGVRTYPFGDVFRWRYPDGRLHESVTVDEPNCHR